MKHIRILENLYAVFGAFLFDNRWAVVIVSFLINGFLGLGLLSLSLNNDTESLSINRKTETKELGEKLLALYADTSDKQFAAHSSIKLPVFVEIIVSGKENDNLLNPVLINEINTLLEQIKNINITSVYQGLISYESLCEKKLEKCVIEGYEIVEILSDCTKNEYECFLNVSKLEVQYTKETYDSIIENIGNYTKSNGVITEARHLKFKLFLSQNTVGILKDSKLWQHKFIQEMSKMKNDYLDIVYAHSTSLWEALGEETYPDIRYFGLAFTILLTYLGFYLSGGDCVSKRIHIGRMGTIVVPLSVLGAWGLTCGSGLQFTNTVGVMPYFAIYFELNNVLITLNKVTDSVAGEGARERVSRVLRATGVPVTITTISYVAAFAVGSQSEYLAMRIVAKYTVATVCFIYINHMTFFTACLAIHEQRIDQNRHCCTCTEIQPKKEATNRSCCYLCCCTGDGSKAADNVASILEKLSRMLVSCFVLRSFFKMLVLPIFVIFVAFSIWKTNSFTIGLYNPEHLTSSYYRKFVDTNDRVFKSDFYVTFVIPGFIHYGDFNFTNDVSFLKESLAANENIDSSSFISWCEAYIRFLNTSDPFKNDTFDDRITTFLSSHTQFKHDFAFDRDGTIISTRVYVKTRNVRTMTDILLLKQSLLIEKYISDRTAVLEKNNYITQVKSKMSKTDKLQNMTKRLTLTLYAPMFIFVDKYTRPLIESLIQIGVLIATNIILTTIVCPHVRVIVIQLFSFATTLVGLSGMMSVFGVEMTSFSMIIVVLGMCYVGDVNTHMLYSFYTTFRIDRQSRAHAVLTTTSITYFNTIIASLLGLLVLLLAKSYIFVTVMKILMITLILCFVQSILIYPIVLSLFGPNICHDGLIVKRISVPKIYRDLNGLKASDLKANNAYDNPNFNKGIAESNICGDLDDVKDRNLQANGALDQFKF